MIDVSEQSLFRKMLCYCIIFGIDIYEILRMPPDKYRAWFEHVTNQVMDAFEFKINYGIDLDDWEEYDGVFMSDKPY